MDGFPINYKILEEVKNDPRLCNHYYLKLFSKKTKKARYMTVKKVFSMSKEERSKYCIEVINYDDK